MLKLPLIALNEAKISVKSKSTTAVGRDILSRLCLRHCYSLILAWFMSLLDKPNNNYTDKVSSLPPFTVVGLQQVATNGELSLDVIITESKHQKLSRHQQQQQADDGKSRKRKDSKQSFYQSVYKYLSTTNFSKLFPWIIKQDNHIIAKCNQVNFHLPDGIHLLLNQSISNFIKVERDCNIMQHCLDHRHSFFWITLDTDDSTNIKNDDCTSYEYPFQTTTLKLHHELYSNPQTNFAFFYEFWSQGFDISGLRTLYDDRLDRDNPVLPDLYIALRGPLAIEKCRHIIGPLDANLAKRTDPTSLTALYCSQSKRSGHQLLSCTNSKLRSLDQLCQIFGGRMPLDEHNQVITDTFNCQQDIYLLAACVETSIMVILSPWIPIDHIPPILKCCLSHGFILQDLHRTSLTHGQLVSLSMQKCYAMDSSKSKNETKDGNQNSSYPSTVTFLHLRRENALHQSSQLIEIIVRHLTPWIQNHGGKINTGDLIKILPYYDESLKSINNQFNLLPSTNPILLNCNLPPFYAYPDYEQVVVVNFTSIKLLSPCVDAMAKLIHLQDMEQVVSQRRLEVIGLKYIPQLPATIAGELSQFEVGHIGYKESIQSMIGMPAVSILIRGELMTATVRWHSCTALKYLVVQQSE